MDLDKPAERLLAIRKESVQTVQKQFTDEQLIRIWLLSWYYECGVFGPGFGVNERLHQYVAKQYPNQTLMAEQIDTRYQNDKSYKYEDWLKEYGF